MIRYLRIVACSLGLAVAAGTAWGQDSPSRQETLPGQVRQRTVITFGGQAGAPNQQPCTGAPCPGASMAEIGYFLQLAEILGPCAAPLACPGGSCGIVLGCHRASQSACPAGQCPALAGCGSHVIAKIIAGTAADLVQVCRILHHQGRYAEVECLARRILALDPHCTGARVVLTSACRHTGHNAGQCAVDCSEECEAKTCATKACCAKCSRSKGDCACGSKCCEDCVCTTSKSKTSCACKDKCCCDKDGSNCACGETCKCKPAAKTTRTIRRGARPVSVIVICPGHGQAFGPAPVCCPVPFSPQAVLAGLIPPPCPPFMAGMGGPGCPFGCPLPPPARTANVLPMPHSVPALPGANATYISATPNCTGPACVPNNASAVMQPPKPVKPATPVKVSAKGNRVQITSPCLTVQCDRISMCEDSRALAEGNVSVEFHSTDRPGSIAAERILIGLEDGSYEVNPGKATPTPRPVKATNCSGTVGSLYMPGCMEGGTTCPEAPTVPASTGSSFFGSTISGR